MPGSFEGLAAILLVLAAVDQGQTAPAPAEEGQLSPQEVADRFLEVRAKLNKPGDLPAYRLGEPIVVELDIRNMSREYYFDVPLWNRLQPGPALPYVVGASRDGRPVPYTTLGQTSLDRLDVAEPIEGAPPVSPVWPFKEENSRIDVVHTTQATPAKVMANLTCDLTEVGEYQLQVRFRVRVYSLSDGEGPLEPGSGSTVVKEVRFAEPLKLRVDGRFYRIGW